MPLPTQQIVEDWIMTIRVAIDPDSPFRGMIQLHEIFDLPLDAQQAIHDSLTPEELDALKELYGGPE